MKRRVQSCLVSLLATCGKLWVHLPYRWQMAMGRRLGALFYCLARKRRRIAAINIGLCFPRLTQIEQEQLIRQAFLSAGMALMESFIAWFMSDKAFDRLTFLGSGRANADAAMAQGKGIIFCSGHMTCLEIVGRAYGRLYDFSVVYKPVKNPALQKMFERYRGRHYKEMLAHRDVKTIIRRLRAGDMVWYAPDQDFGPKPSVFADFMGVQTATLTATAKLARLGNAVVVPLFFHRLEKDRGYALEVLPFFEDFPSGDDQEDARQYNAVLEAYVKRYPDQYLWLHRRFKTRPPGTPKIY